MRKIFLIGLFVTLLSSCDKLEDLFNIGSDEKYDYAYIDMTDYPDWQDGIITKNDLYMLVREDVATDETVVYANMINSNNKGLAMYFDTDMRLKAFVTEEIVCNVRWTEYETADLQIITTDGESKYVPSVYIPYTQEYTTRGLPLIPIFANAARTVMAILTIEDVVSLSNNVLSGNFMEAGFDMAQILIGGVVKKAKLAVRFATDMTIEVLDALRKKLQEEPSLVITNLSVGATNSISEGDWDLEIHYNITVKVKGGFLMHDIYPYHEGNWTHSIGDPLTIANFNRPTSWSVKYSSQSKPHTNYIYFKTTTMNGEEITSSNRLVFDFNGSICNISLSSDSRVNASAKSVQTPTTDTLLAPSVVFDGIVLPYN